MAGGTPVQEVAPAATPKPVGNPALRMMGRFVRWPRETCWHLTDAFINIGLPRFKFKLPSRNWLIFLTITGSFTSTLLYDRYQKRKAQRRWCDLVSHLAEEPLPANMMPRKIKIFLSAPPGDSIRVAREHFHEYVKPVLVAGALDWEVIEGRREGEVRAGLAEKIRKLRKRNGEVSQIDSTEEAEEDLVSGSRQKAGIKEWDAVEGDLILGRHTWKEYVRGLHEGWLGPLDQPQPPELSDTLIDPSSPPPQESSSSDEPSSKSTSEPTPQGDTSTSDPPAKKPKPAPAPPFITPADYSSCSVAPTLPPYQQFPSVPLPLPHILGFFHTPTRIYRFLTRRRLAESTGHSVAALVLASQSRPYSQSTQYASAIDPDDASPNAGKSAEAGAVAEARQTWEQEAFLRHEEQEWHKSAWKANAEGDDSERVWQETITVDSRIGQRMRLFELKSDEEKKAFDLEEERKREEKGYWEQFKDWTGWKEGEKKGWDMGFEGEESD